MSARRPLLAAVLLAAACSAPQRDARAPAPASPGLLAHFRLVDADRSAAEAGLPAWGPAAPGAAAADPAPGTPPAAPPVPAPAAAPAGTLHLEDVLRAVELHFPLLLAALEELEIAAGNLTAAEGAFDTRLKASTRQQSDGYYEGDTYDVSVQQPTTLRGLAFDAGWRLGKGGFPDYDGKLKTNEDGELRVGVLLPLLQGGAIDPQRVAMWQAAVQAERAGPVILAKRLEATRKAAETYWKWVAAGGKRAIARRQLEIAQARHEQLRGAVQAGERPELDLLENQRLIVDRQTRLAAAERSLQQAAILLSLYWRDDQGRSVVPPDAALPETFPVPRDPAETRVPDDERLALAGRPELRALELELESLRLDRDLYENQWLPDLDLGLYASQDYGEAVNDPDDKGDPELEAALRFELPLQRRKPLGARRAVQGKIAKLDQELAFQRDLVLSEVRDANSALGLAWLRLDQARENAELARRLEQAERIQLDLGSSDLLRVNLREQQSAQAEAGLVDVLAEYFMALADYRAVLGIPYDEVVEGRPVGG